MQNKKKNYIEDNPSKKSKKKGKWKKIKAILKILLKILVILAVIIGIIVFLFVSPVFNITKIKVENAEQISESAYIALSEIEIGENIFKVSKTKVESLIKQEPYVEEIEIKRQYPRTIILNVTERKVAYMIENNGRYIYIDKNGYLVEENTAKLDLPVLKGITTSIEDLVLGDKINDEDLLKFNDLIKIVKGIENNEIEEKLSNIDISNDNNYILEFEKEGKKVILGDTSDLSTKMLWIKYFMQQKKGQSGTIYLNTDNVYFTPIG